jgi:hypothetical protein
VAPDVPANYGAILFGELAEMWRRDYVDNPKVRLAEPTRLKYRTRLRSHILPRWRDVPISQMRSKQILDWLHANASLVHDSISDVSAPSSPSPGVGVCQTLQPRRVSWAAGGWFSGQILSEGDRTGLARFGEL